MPISKLNSQSPKLCMTILLNAKSIDLIFSNAEELNQFCFGICSLWKGEIEEDAKM